MLLGVVLKCAHKPYPLEGKHINAKDVTIGI